jgi:hypothetical protein
VLGLGGVRMLRALGFQHLTRFHLNEGHASLLTLELLQEEAKRAGRTCVNHDDIRAVREKCIFTTHQERVSDFSGATSASIVTRSSLCNVSSPISHSCFNSNSGDFSNGPIVDDGPSISSTSPVRSRRNP